MLMVWGEGLAFATTADQAPAVESNDGADIDTATVRTDAALKVTTWTCNGRNVGTGFVTPYGIVTAAHVVDGAVSVQLAPDAVTNDAAAAATGIELGEPIVLERRHADQVDAAVLAGPKGWPSYVVRETQVQPGEPLAIVGFPFGQELTVVAGRHIGDASGASFGVDADRVFVVSAPAELGVSGGPVLDADGRAVGIVVGVETNTNTAIVVPLADLGPLLAGDGVVDESASC